MDYDDYFEDYDWFCGEMKDYYTYRWHKDFIMDNIDEFDEDTRDAICEQLALFDEYFSIMDIDPRWRTEQDNERLIAITEKLDFEMLNHLDPLILELLK